MRTLFADSLRVVRSVRRGGFRISVVDIDGDEARARMYGRMPLEISDAGPDKGLCDGHDEIVEISRFESRIDSDMDAGSLSRLDLVVLL